MASASDVEPEMVKTTNDPLSHHPLGTITLLYEDFDVSTPAGAGGFMTGTVSRIAGNTDVTGLGTSFLAELFGATHITYNNPAGGADTQVINKLLSLEDNTNLTINDGTIQPLSGATDFTNSNFTTFDAFHGTDTSTIVADPSDVSTNKPSGERFYYSRFLAYDWNKGGWNNLAEAYAADNLQNLWDLGWDDEASWVIVVQTILSYAGWNASITQINPDPLTINNANQEIVVYYGTESQTYNGVAAQIIKPITFIEQSGIATNYSTQLGGEPFRALDIRFDAIDYKGIHFDTAGTPAEPGEYGVAAQIGKRDIVIANMGTTYNSTAGGITYTDQNFAPGQFEVFVKYTTYDGFEAIAAKELIKMGVQVSPENVDWYRQEVEMMGEVKELDWPFDEPKEAPNQDNPESFDPLSETPLDYVPRNDEASVGEEDAN